MDSNSNPLAVVASQDLSVDMFTERGFQLAQRIGKAFATSDAVPAQFRAQVLKKARDENGNWVEQWVENPAAMGNCLIAIETARAVRMSITAVMQNANVIENRLTWSGKFVIAAINASGRFTPLRFQVRNLGLIKAKYREKLGYNQQKRGFDFKDTEVELENLECIAWALPAGLRVPATIGTLQQARDANLPVIESAPVSMRLAVEEGWYGKPGSKWQTEMKYLMLQYRAGSFFGNIHAPDIVMGMGRTTEEVADIDFIDMDTGELVQQRGKPEVRMPREATPMAEVVQQAAPPADAPVDQTTGEVQQASNDEAKPEAEHQPEQAATPAQRAPRAIKTVAAEAPSAAPATTPQTNGNTVLASEGECKLILNRARNNGIDLAQLIVDAGLQGLPVTLEGLTRDGFVALKDALPAAQ